MDAHLTPFNLFVGSLLLFLIIFVCINQAAKAVIHIHAVYNIFSGEKNGHGQRNDE